MRISWLGLVVVLIWPGIALANLRFAVLEFENASTDPSYEALGRGLQSMLTTDLSRVEQVTLVERARLEELLAELDLAESGRVDPKTAAKLGKLSGASHLLDGSFTVLSGKMRLDARLLEVQSGKVVLAEALTGPRDDFWDLQKQLVDRLVKSLSIPLSSKERATLRTPHTADFEAFRQFSTGLSLFDDGRYDESLRALEKAVQADEGFLLAQATLEDYRELVEQLRERADAIDLANAREAELETLGAAREGARIIEKLQGIAAVSGTRGQRQRLAALHTLACIHDGGRHYDLSDVEDRFSLARAHDQYVQRYIGEAVELFPKVPVLPRCATFMKKAPRPDHFDEDFGELVDLLWEGSWDTPREYWPKTRNRYLGRWLDSTTIVQTEIEPLQLDHAETLAFMLRVPGWREKLGQPLDVTTSNDFNWVVQMARRMVSAGRIDEATASLERLAEQLDDASQLRRISEMVEKNARYKALEDLARHDLAREYLRLALANGGEPWVFERTLKGFASPSDPDGLRSLSRLRRVERVGNWRVPTLRVADHPVWMIFEQGHVVTGPRPDPRRADELRYHMAGEPRPPGEALLVIDGVPRSAYQLGFTLDGDVPADFVPPDGPREVASRRPTVDVLIGVRDVDAPPTRDPIARAERRLRPMVMHAVRLSADRDEVALVRRTSVSREGTARIEDFEETVVQTGRAPTRGARKVRVDVDGTQVVVRVDGRTVRLSAPDLGPGYYGVSLRDPGFVRISDLVVETGR